ncbi:MFS transporter [Stackebrandtia soli]|uniref:MFS transporter n=1 Tax=Stackebrandtia soli TaxID=1892856 RepID=UPI0039EC51C5
MTTGQSHPDQPATFREVFNNRESVGLFSSYTLSTAGSMLTRVAVTFLVFAATDSPLMAAATFAITYAPYLGPAQILATLADRFPYRSTMIACDVIRMVLIGLVAIPGMPLWAMLVLVFASAMVTPAYQASRAALLQEILTGERLTLALSVLLTLSQSAQLTGYILGGVLASIDPRMALLLTAAGFALSAAILHLTVQRRPPAIAKSDRGRLLTDTAAGLRLVFGHPRLRLIAVIVFCVLAFTIIPEGAAAPWAAHLGGGALLQGILMASAPLAAIVSSLVFTRFVPPATRQRYMRPLFMLAPVSLTLGLLDPAAWGAVAIGVVCNLSGAILPTLNGMFARELPEGFRARANAVMMGGMSLVQGIAVLSMGLLAQVGLSIPRSIGVWGVAGLAAGLVLMGLWTRLTAEPAEPKRASAEIAETA